MEYYVSLVLRVRGQWSSDVLARARDEGELVINPIVYAEVSAGFHLIEDLRWVS
jgi:hypothetical protein